MWRLTRLNVTGTPAGTVDAFLLGFGVDEDSEVYALTTEDGGPDASSTTGRVWRLVPANETAPTATVTPTATAPAAGGQGATVEIAADNMAFDTSTVTVPAGAAVTMNFENRDEGVPHNVAVYTDSSATTPIYVGEIVTGPAETAYTFTAPSEPGTYYFRCDVHPSMNGEFVVT